MIKFFLGILIVLFTSFCGYIVARKYRQRKFFFQQFYLFNERFINEISYYRRPLEEFVSLYSYKGEFQVFLREYFNSIRELDGNLKIRELLDFNEYSFLNQEERGVVTDYFLMLGKGDSLSQKTFFSSTKAVLEKLKNESEVQCKKYGDLYIKIGFLCGLLILILII